MLGMNRSFAVDKYDSCRLRHLTDIVALQPEHRTVVLPHRHPALLTAHRMQLAYRTPCALLGRYDGRKCPTIIVPQNIVTPVYRDF